TFAKRPIPFKQLALESNLQGYKNKEGLQAYLHVNSVSISSSNICKKFKKVPIFARGEQDRCYLTCGSPTNGMLTLIEYSKLNTMSKLLRWREREVSEWVITLIETCRQMKF
ncbi:hypothetical protein HK096_010197, partial [Nowakowskiella sp. JEL0078]